jgi:hypothetical protein
MRTAAAMMLLALSTACEGDVTGFDGYHFGAPRTARRVEAMLPELNPSAVAVTLESGDWIVAGNGFAARVTSTAGGAPQVKPYGTADMLPMGEALAIAVDPSDEATLLYASIAVATNGTELSPLTSDLGTGYTLAAGDPDHLGAWLAGAQLVHLQADGFDQMTFDGAQGMATALGWGGPSSQGRALWAAFGENLFAVDTTQGTAQLFELQLGPVRGVASLGATVMAGSTQGLAERAADGTWNQWAIPEPGVSALAASDTLAWAVIGGSLHARAEGEPFAPLVDSTGAVIDHISALALDLDGAALLVRDGHLQRVSLTRPVHIGGLIAGQTVRDPLTAQVWLDETPAQLRVSVAGRSLDISPDADAGTAYDFTISPAGLPQGDATVQVEATFDDGEVVDRSLAFIVAADKPVSWSADVAPWAQVGCGCHMDPSNQPNLPKFPTADGWRARADLLMDRVVVRGTMPPIGNAAPTPAQKELLRRWLEGSMAD